MPSSTCQESKIRKRIEAFRDAGLTDAVAEEEAKLAKILATSGAWLIDDWLPVGNKGMLTAPEGSFKTMLMTYLAVCIASGHSVFGQFVQQGPVLIVDEETPQSSLEKHLDRFSQGFGYHSYKDLPITTYCMKGFRFSRKTSLDPLVAVISSLKPIFITMDSLIAMLPSGRQAIVENDSGIGEAIRDDLNKILTTTPMGSTLLAAHSKKPISELSMEELKTSFMQDLVRGHGSIVGEGCDTGYVLKRISVYPEPTRFAIITKPRRPAIPMSRKIVYVEMEEEAYGSGWARLKEISADVVPPSKYAKAVYQLFKDDKSHGSKELVTTYQLYTKGQIVEGVEELLHRNVLSHDVKPQTYQRNPNRAKECTIDYLNSLENPDKGSI